MALLLLDLFPSESCILHIARLNYSFIPLLLFYSSLLKFLSHFQSLFQINFSLFLSPIFLMNQSNSNELLVLIDEEQVKLPKHFGNYHYIRTIGKGATAIVIEARNEKTNQNVACKIVPRNIIIQNGLMEKFEQELRILEKVFHPYICQVYEILYYQDIIIIVMEYCPNGDLFDYILTLGQLQEKELIRIARALIDAINYLHSRHIVHRDIKPENIVFTQNMIPKLIDFGISHEIYSGNLLKTKSGTYLYSPPEALLEKEYDAYAADIWSLGITLFTMQFGCFPWKADTQESDIAKFITSTQVTIPPCPPKIRFLLRSMLDFHPERRPKISELVHYFDQDLANASLPILNPLLSMKNTNAKNKFPLCAKKSHHSSAFFLKTIGSANFRHQMRPSAIKSRV